MEKSVCRDCNRSVVVVLDYSSGDTICVECGLVLDSHYIDERSEWRTFADDSSSNDPNRVGAASNPLLTDGGLSTTITRANAKQDDFATLGKWQNHGNNRDRSLLLAFQTIGAMAEDLNLVSTIKDRANEIFKTVEDGKLTKGRGLNAMAAACLYVACRQEDRPRTFKEICSVSNGVTRKAVGRAASSIVKRLEEDGKNSAAGSCVQAKDFLRRFCSLLGMPNLAIRATIETVTKVEELDIRKSPISIAAAAMYMISLVSENKKSLKEISLVAGVAEATIKGSFSSLRPHATRLVPEWYCKPDVVKRLVN